MAKLHVLVFKTHCSLWASRLKARERVSTTVIEPSVVSEIDILVSSMAHFNISASDHMKKLKNVPSIGNASRFENDFDLAGSEASEGDNTEKSGQAHCGTARSRDRFHEI